MKPFLSACAALGLALVLQACVTGATGATGTPPPREGPAASGSAGTQTDPREGQTVSPMRDFDPKAVSKEAKTAVFVDAKALVEKLNKIIRDRDFEAWLTNLTPEYRSYWSDPKVLSDLSELTLKRVGVRLQNLRDYFLYVVCLSRENARLDDIEFIGADRIMALTVNSKGESVVLYYFEKIDDVWLIGIGR